MAFRHSREAGWPGKSLRLLKIEQEREPQGIGQRTIVFGCVQVGDIHPHDVVPEPRSESYKLAVSIVRVLVVVSGTKRE